jgi:para-aminobenzoate synthetase
MNDGDETYSQYLRLRARNPAYYSTYISFPTLITPRGEGIHIISSSPERFLKIDEKRNVEMMPIKGTMARVKAGQCVCTPTTGCKGLDKGGEECSEEGKREDTRRAEWLRNDKKERAENLMVSILTSLHVMIADT